MEITEVKVFPVNEEKLKAFVSIVLDHCFMVNDIKVIQGKDGLFISMPSRRKKNGEFKDVAHPLNNETRRTMETRILGEYHKVRGGELAVRPLAGDPPVVAAPVTATSVPVTIAAMPPVAGVPPAGAATPASPLLEQAAAVAESSTDDVDEFHLRDSFWTVT